MGRKVIVCFPRSGGVQQFTSELSARLGGEYEYFQAGERWAKLAILKYLAYDEVVFSNNNLFIYLFMLVYPRKAKLILHDHKVRVAAPFRDRVMLFLFSLFKKRFVRIIIHSRHDPVATKLMKCSNVEYLSMPPHGVPPVIRSDRRHKPNDEIKILCFGRIEPYKNFEYMAEAVSGLRGISLTIAGDGEASSELKKFSDHSDNVRLINRYIQDDEVVDLFLSHHYLALPYIDITQTGLVDLGCAFSVPLLLSNIEAFKQFGNSGFATFYSLFNVDELRNTLLSLPIPCSNEYRSASEEAYKNYLENKNLWVVYTQALTKNL